MVITLQLDTAHSQKNCWSTACVTFSFYMCSASNAPHKKNWQVISHFDIACYIGIHQVEHSVRMWQQEELSFISVHHAHKKIAPHISSLIIYFIRFSLTIYGIYCFPVHNLSCRSDIYTYVRHGICTYILAMVICHCMTNGQQLTHPCFCEPFIFTDIADKLMHSSPFTAHHFCPKYSQ